MKGKTVLKKQSITGGYLNWNIQDLRRFVLIMDLTLIQMRGIP